MTALKTIVKCCGLTFTPELYTKPRNTFGQLFCGSLDIFGILCVGLYRMIDDEDHNPEHKRFVITRPANEFNLLPSDLVFCAIPYNTAYYKKNDASESQTQCEIINVVPLAPEMQSHTNFPSTRGSVEEGTSQPRHSPVRL
ncbi:PREDICTED: potassium channel subfamily U member 1-like [Chinchilla lanigera]|uniref:potassium channel subfamily U member 1-like n=1 Tax=Chinchilla lanigera TaxID=34839 RepID=UPI000695D51B|nr:PREDICTED: potassium channel subfamily U member 1-like [Chinchilla lanigera]